MLKRLRLNVSILCLKNEFFRLFILEKAVYLQTRSIPSFECSKDEDFEQKQCRHAQREGMSTTSL